MGAILFMFWGTSGLWPPTGSNAPTGDIAQDLYGNTITVGSVVKFVGVVTAINLHDSHFGDVQVQMRTSIPGVSVGDTNFASPQSPNFNPPNQALKNPKGFHPKQLIVGS